MFRFSRLMWCGLLVAQIACAGPPEPVGICQVLALEHEPVIGGHFDVNEPLTWDTNPPSSGPHAFYWAEWGRAYAPALPRSEWVHNLEHGGVALLYNCPRGCPEIVAELTAIMDEYPDDPLCSPEARHRLLVTGDPGLPDDVTVAAAAWGATYTASCVDRESLIQFIRDHYGLTAENICTSAEELP